MSRGLSKWRIVAEFQLKLSFVTDNVKLASTSDLRASQQWAARYTGAWILLSSVFKDNFPAYVTQESGLHYHSCPSSLKHLGNRLQL